MPTTARVEERIARAIQLIRQYPLHHQRKKVLMEEYQCGWRTADRAIYEARKRLMDAIKGDKDELRAFCFNVLQDIATSPIAKPGEQVKAVTAMADLLGLNAPTKIAPVTPDGESSWSPESTEELRAKLFDRLTQLSKQ
jgi:hypothetical protein